MVKTLSHDVANSSTILKVEWYPSDAAALRDTSQLAIHFKSGGRYVYKGVPRSAYDALIGAESVGRHFHQHIKSKFEVLR